MMVSSKEADLFIPTLDLLYLEQETLHKDASSLSDEQLIMAVSYRLDTFECKTPINQYISSFFNTHILTPEARSLIEGTYIAMYSAIAYNEDGKLVLHILKE